MRKLIRFRWPFVERGHGKRKNSCYIEPIEIFSTLTSKHCGDHTSDCSNGVLIGGENVEIRAVSTVERAVKHQNGRRMKDDGEPMFTLTAQDMHGVAICPSLKIKEATAKGYAEAKVGDGVNLSNPNSNTRLGRVGNGIVNTLTCNNQMGVVIDALYANRKPGESNICPTLRSERNGLLAKEAGECNNVRIRRLTPRECWRLQGFPDEYFDKAKAAGVSDSQLYKQAGNSVSVPVAYAIGLKLKEIENE